MDSPKKRTNKFVEISSFKYFWTVKKKKKLFFSVFGRIYGPQNCLQFYLTFSIVESGKIGEGGIRKLKKQVTSFMDGP